MALHSGVDGLDLATEIAKDDPDPEVQASVVDALAFRQADRHVVEVLRKAGEKTFDLIVRKGLVDKVDRRTVRNRTCSGPQSAGGRRTSANDRSARDRIHARCGDHSAELTDIISTMEIGRQQDAWTSYQIY